MKAAIRAATSAGAHEVSGPMSSDGNAAPTVAPNSTPSNQPNGVVAPVMTNRT